jgi:hypothetical protein
VKVIVTLAACIVVLGSSAVGSAAAVHNSARIPAAKSSILVNSVSLAGAANFLSQPRMSAAAVFATGTVTTTPTGTSTATPTTTPTTSPYPDPQVILSNALQVLSAINTTHFEGLIDDERANVEKLHIDITGDATCKGPAMKGHISGSDTLEGTSQTKSSSQDFVWIKNKAWIKSSATHKKWTKYTKAALTVLKQPLNFKQFIFPLVCTGGQLARHSEFLQTQPQIKDLVNLGPDTFQGIPVWHIHFIYVTTSSTGTTQELPYDFLISQDHFLPYVNYFTVTDTTVSETAVVKQILTKFGVKVTVTDPTKKKKV